MAAAAPRQPAAELEKRAFDLVNRRRTATGVRALAWSEPVAAAARRHSFNMQQRGFFAHKDPKHGDTGQRLTAEGIGWRAVAENIYQERGISNPVQAAVEGWMKSHGHRRNILDPIFTHSGMGVSIAADGTHTFTQIFLRPA